MFYGLLHMDTPMLTNQKKTCIHQLCADTGAILIRAMAREGQMVRESIGNDDDDSTSTYLYIWF